MSAAFRIHCDEGPSLPVDHSTKPSSYSRVPHEITARLRSPEHQVFTAIVGFCRDGQMFTDRTNFEIANACGKSAKSVERILPKLESTGVITREGRTGRRRIYVNISLASRKDETQTSSFTLKNEGKEGKKLPSDLRGITLKIEGNYPQKRGELPSDLRGLLQEEKKQELKKVEPSDESRKRDSADSPETGNTPPEVPPAPPRPLSASDVMHGRELATARIGAANVGSAMHVFWADRLDRHERATRAIQAGELSPEGGAKNRPPGLSPNLPGGRFNPNCIPDKIIR